MMQSNLGLVHAVARTFHSSGVPHADLVQEGTTGSLAQWSCSIPIAV
jgi:DNA-directed RNA polymerase sigma subunit (sigma70/sigma32)